MLNISSYAVFFSNSLDLLIQSLKMWFQDRRRGRDLGHIHCDSPKDGLIEKQVMETSMKAAAQ